MPNQWLGLMNPAAFSDFGLDESLLHTRVYLHTYTSTHKHLHTHIKCHHCQPSKANEPLPDGPGLG